MKKGGHVICTWKPIASRLRSVGTVECDWRGYECFETLGVATGIIIALIRIRNSGEGSKTI